MSTTPFGLASNAIQKNCVLRLNLAFWQFVCKKKQSRNNSWNLMKAVQCKPFDYQPHATVD